VHGAAFFDVIVYDGAEYWSEPMNKSVRTPIVLKYITDPQELEKTRAQKERFERNWKWFQAHAAEIYPRHRGKCYCVAGQELFVAETPQEVLALARAAHPDDDGRFTGYIFREKRTRIYANRRLLASLR
jgi:hypothetical protein